MSGLIGRRFALASTLIVTAGFCASTDVAPAAHKAARVATVAMLRMLGIRTGQRRGSRTRTASGLGDDGPVSRARRGLSNLRTRRAKTELSRRLLRSSNLPNVYEVCTMRDARGHHATKPARPWPSEARDFSR